VVDVVAAGGAGGWCKREHLQTRAPLTVPKLIRMLPTCGVRRMGGALACSGAATCRGGANSLELLLHTPSIRQAYQVDRHANQPLGPHGCCGVLLYVDPSTVSRLDTTQ
jgi:hypothetical protein